MFYWFPSLETGTGPPVRVVVARGNVDVRWYLARQQQSQTEDIWWVGSAEQDISVGYTGTYCPKGYLKNGIYYWVIVPFWLLIVCFSSCPVIAIARGPVRRRWRRTHGRCLYCGYNLTGNVTGRCPECGKDD